ncbi:2-hydroxychromene-2-carboxylate isomerase [Bradyrhizobium lablabi]|uniref:2-hydroxychromene-2-carboxylate isomerase n=1 Tax=Bradyrhizobium lablabi TaxID=722472 RepID=UPI001BAAB0AE|nr:2-hydroxychromene-2-carboxylate isomerase [Bradyrhizobium lablabi]MBR1123164.1 2-hydroxychromene-2-carboxylate isomerase [Bradyrhizobium lablabi]
MANDRIVYYFWTISDWAYFGQERLEALARKYNVAIDYRPVDLPKVYARTGGILLGQRSKQRQDYRIAELKRWRKRLSIPLNIEPKYFPVNQDASSRLIVAAKLAGLPLGNLTFTIMRGMWADEVDISDEATLRKIAAPHVPDVDALLAASKTPEVQAEYDRYTDQAPADGVFGSPFYLYGGDILWGQDRLEFLEELLAEKQGKG